MVAHLLWEQGVVRSSRTSSTIFVRVVKLEDTSALEAAAYACGFKSRSEHQTHNIYSFRIYIVFLFYKKIGDCE